MYQQNLTCAPARVFRTEKPQCRKAAEDFEVAGYTVKLRIYPGVGHTFPRFTNRELGKALKFVLGAR